VKIAHKLTGCERDKGIGSIMTAVETAERNRQITALALEIREQLGEHNVLGELSRELAENRVRLSDLSRALEATQRELAAVKLTQKARDILMPRAALEYAGRSEVQVDSSAPLAAESGFHALERDGNGTLVGGARDASGEVHEVENPAALWPAALALVRDARARGTCWRRRRSPSASPRARASRRTRPRRSSGTPQHRPCP
jgi:hypothetical protein